jgi:hypothetical protein
MLTAADDCVQDPVVVAIETLCGLLVASLRTTARRVYAINPLAVARYRERHSVARAKSDHADALMVANILRVDAHLRRRVPTDTELCQVVAVLARRTRKRSGGASPRTLSCGHCCASSFRRTWLSSPAGSR